MSARKAIAGFLGWLIVGFLVIAVATIYGFDYFEGTLGGRMDNLLFSAASYTGVAFAITVGFAAVLAWRGEIKTSFRGLLIAAAVACGLVHTFAIVAPLIDRGSWHLNLLYLALYSAIVGAVVAAGLVWVTRIRRYAA
jgi:hypothetical protein